MRSLWARDIVFGDFYDDNVCACAANTSILLPVANLSPEMDSVTSVSCKTQTLRL